MSNKGKKLSVHYRGTLEDGTQFDSSYDRGQTLQFTCGAGQMIAGFDKAVEDMQVGEKKKVLLQPSEAYGERNEDLVIAFPKGNISQVEQLREGDHVSLSGPGGIPIPAVITQLTDDEVYVDANHELAGKALIFEIELVSCDD
ncbi:MAG: peptidylprolyl isomerase [Atopobium minutum]|uniref:FKBP-type peptidyl-prolyl cis-trans isomerase n=1 Tax=Atopobium TaxID=1380 RepID=UPI0003ADBE4A|nr:MULTISPECIES: peptidylprolyl isomerase [Atopobium]ERL13837.1 putative FKBP-type peptidyl-prolyl cis-trans isomerase [Atopobium sp. BV3Ac4]MDU4969991.1 peptidylprolyl isomerase [Atopobium minutum]MDU5357830.1 peptidylprolyl isomerase [Atopobium minutum]